ncbi:hypothetical protein J4207_05195 [Candidatus Woesearchaeota archaeon]|nr:hypothetical protein [Candidatus Woesearchaeota archaeon]HLC80762.1 hypothetical protein [Candidatus Nanoarchaeia archaeon]
MEFKKLFLYVFMILAVSAFAAAALPTEIALGSNSQVRSDKVTTVVLTPTILSVVLTDVPGAIIGQPVALALEGVATKYTASLSAASITFADAVDALVAHPVTMTITVPKDQDSEKSKVGTLKLTAGTTITQLPINMETQSKLSFKGVEADVAGETDGDVGEGDKVSKKALLLDEVTFSVEMENLFPNENKEGDMSDVEITVTIEGLDDGDDVEESSDNFDLGTEDKETQDIVFTIPKAADDQIYDVTLVAEGEDENGATHKAARNFQLEVKKNKDDVRINKAEVSPSTVACDETFTLSVDVSNYGSNKAEDVYVNIFNKDLSIDIKEEGLTLDKSVTKKTNKFTKTYELMVKTPSDSNKKVAQGKYPITVYSFVDSDKKTDEEFAYVTASTDCKKAEEKKQEPVVEIKTTANVSADTSDKDSEEVDKEVTEVLDTIEEPGFEFGGVSSKGLLIGGGILVLVMLIVIIALAAKATSK